MIRDLVLELLLRLHSASSIIEVLTS